MYRIPIHMLAPCICIESLFLCISAYLSLYRIIVSIHLYPCFSVHLDSYINVFLYSCISVSVYLCIFIPVSLAVSLYPLIQVYLYLNVPVSLYESLYPCKTWHGQAETSQYLSIINTKRNFNSEILELKIVCPFKYYTTFKIFMIWWVSLSIIY